VLISTVLHDLHRIQTLRQLSSLIATLPPKSVGEEIEVDPYLFLGLGLMLRHSFTEWRLLGTLTAKKVGCMEKMYLVDIMAYVLHCSFSHVFL
jgi:hypothetical protein